MRKDETTQDCPRTHELVRQMESKLPAVEQILSEAVRDSSSNDLTDADPIYFLSFSRIASILFPALILGKSFVARSILLLDLTNMAEIAALNLLGGSAHNRLLST